MTTLPEGSNQKNGRISRIWRGVTVQLFLIAVLPLIILVLLITFGSLNLHHEGMRTLVADRNLRAARSAAASLESEINHRGKMLELLARDVSSGEPAQAQLDALAPDLALFDGGSALLDQNGKAIAFGGSPAIDTLIGAPGWEDLYSTLAQGQAGKALYAPVQKIGAEMVVPVSVMTEEKTILLGLFSAQKLLNDGLTVISEDEPVTIMVVDSSYQVLFQRGALSPDESVYTHPGMDHALSGHSAIDHITTGSGEHVISTSAVEPVGWALMIEESWEDINSPLLQATQNAPLVIIPILALSLLAIGFGLRQIVQPMQALEKKAGDLARGDFETIRQPVGGVPEVRHLQATLVQMAGALKEAQTSLHQYVGAVTDSVENERRSLARELHDGTLQSLIALGQYTQYALHWNKDPHVEKSLQQVLSLVEEGVKNLRQLVTGLRPIYIEDLGLATALAMQASNSNLRIPVAFSQEGEERRLKPEVEMTLYRIAQEALNNIQRHSEAQTAQVQLIFGEEGLVLEIRDDGRGFEPPVEPIHFARLGHYGLLGMQERADLIGAALAIKSAAGQGTTVHIHLADPSIIE